MDTDDDDDDDDDNEGIALCWQLELQREIFKSGVVVFFLLFFATWVGWERKGVGVER